MMNSTSVTEESSQTMRSEQKLSGSDGWTLAIICDRRRMQREQVADVRSQNPAYCIVASTQRVNVASASS